MTDEADLPNRIAVENLKVMLKGGNARMPPPFHGRASEHPLFCFYARFAGFMIAENFAFRIS